MASPTVAANAYAISPASSTPAAPARVRNPGAGGGVPRSGAVLKDAIGSVLDAARNPTRKPSRMASGKANVMDVVTAVAETDVAVSTLVSGARPGDRLLRRHHEDADLTGPHPEEPAQPASRRMMRDWGRMVRDARKERAPHHEGKKGKLK